MKWRGLSLQGKLNHFQYCWVEIEKEKSSERGRAWEGRGVEVSIQQGKVDWGKKGKLGEESVTGERGWGRRE
jgi:hypothetical protein